MTLLLIWLSVASAEDASRRVFVIGVLDSGWQVVPDAEVRVEGVVAALLPTGDAYVAELEAAPRPVTVRVRHADFVDLDVPLEVRPGAVEHATNLHVRRPGEPFVVNRGRVVPVRDLRDRVLVHARSPDDLPAIAARHGLVLEGYRCPAQWKEAPSPCIQAVLRRAEGPLPDTGSAALAALRGDPDVVVAGPLAVHDPEVQGALGLTNEIELVLADGATADVLTARGLEVLDVAGRVVRVRVGADVGHGVAGIAVELDALPEIEGASTVTFGLEGR